MAVRIGVKFSGYSSRMMCFPRPGSRVPVFSADPGIFCRPRVPPRRYRRKKRSRVPPKGSRLKACSRLPPKDSQRIVLLVFFSICHYNITRVREKRDITRQSTSPAGSSCRASTKNYLSLPSQTTNEISTPPVKGANLTARGNSDDQVHPKWYYHFLSLSSPPPSKEKRSVGGKNSESRYNSETRLPFGNPPGSELAPTVFRCPPPSRICPALSRALGLST